MEERMKKVLSRVASHQCHPILPKNTMVTLDTPNNVNLEHFNAEPQLQAKRAACSVY